MFTFTKQFNVPFMSTSIRYGGVHWSNQVVGGGQDDDEPACCGETSLDSPSRTCHRLDRTGESTTNLSLEAEVQESLRKACAAC